MLVHSDYSMAVAKKLKDDPALFDAQFFKDFIYIHQLLLYIYPEAYQGLEKVLDMLPPGLFIYFTVLM